MSHEANEAQSSKPPCRVCTDFKSWIRDQRKKFEGNAAPPEDKSKKNESSSVVASGGDPSVCPLDRDSLGRNTWSLLHTMAAWYPDKPSKDMQKQTVSFMENLSNLYPCDYCAADMRQDLKSDPPKVESRQDFAQWMCQLHNKVNTKLGKQLFDCSKVDERWRDGWKDGRLVMQSLKNLCESVVKDELHEYSASCLQLLQHLYAMTGDIQSPPIQRLLELVDVNGYMSVTSGLFCQLSAQLVSLIISRDTLDVDEVTIFTMVIRWSQMECRRRALPVTLENRRAVLQGILQHIRFTTVSLHDFGLMMRSQIVPDAEILRIVKTADRTALPYNTQPRTLSSRQIYILGGVVNGSDSASVRTYSVERGCQLMEMHMNEERSWHCAAFCHSTKQIMIVGGDGTSDTAETCDLTGQRSLFTTMPCNEHSTGAACICIGNTVFIMGGGTASCECYDMQQSTWVDMDPLPYPVTAACCALYEEEGKATILLIGGYDTSTDAHLDTVLQYLPDKNQWVDRADLRLPTRVHCASAVNWCGNVVIVGGLVGSRVSNECYSLDVVSQQWVSLPALKIARHLHQAVVLGGQIVALGGLNAFNSVEVFDGEKWTDAQPLNDRMFEFAAVVT